jgi:hypothetical protein
MHISPDSGEDAAEIAANKFGEPISNRPPSIASKNALNLNHRVA